MGFVRTVLGDVPAETLGFCYAHEHLIIADSYTTEKNPDFRLVEVEAIAEELRDAGMGWCVDSMPGGGAGRDVLRLAEVSRRSRVAVVAPTGLHLAKYYPAGEQGGHWGGRLPVDQLAEVFIAEIEQGIDVNDLAGPEVRRSSHRAGVIKVAGGRDRLSVQERRLFEAAAIAHRRTGCPILTHTEEGTAALEQAVLLASNGVDLSHVVLSHLDRNPDPAYHRRVLRTGVNIEYDSFFRWKNRPDNPTFDLLCALLPEFPDQIVLGMDAARRGYWKRLGGLPGMSHLRHEFVPRLAARLGEELVHRLTVTTPARAYCFAGRRHP